MLYTNAVNTPSNFYEANDVRRSNKPDMEGMDTEQMKMQGKLVAGVPVIYSDFAQTPLKAEVADNKPNVVALALVSK